MDKALKVIPNRDDYLLQSHQISRAAYLLPVVQRRLLHVILCQVQRVGDGEHIYEMTVGDVVRALGMDDGSQSYEAIRAAAKGLMQYVLDLDTEDGWVMYHWVDRATLSRKRDTLKFKIDPEMIPHLLEIGQLWTKIPVADLTRLQGKYAYRIFELVMANRGFAGKGGNKPGEWFTDLEFETLRVMLKMAPHEYKLTADLRKKVVDTPIREINEARLGLELTADYDFFRRGRTLRGVRILAHLLRPDEPRNVTPTPADTEEDTLLEYNRELFERLLAEEPTDMFGGELQRQANAYSKMQAHPDFKTPPKKRSKKAPAKLANPIA